MSKNHPDDNIYSILGKLKSLEPTPAEVVKEKAQVIRESVESQGSILAGLREVSSVEQRLQKQFTESQFEKVSKAIQKTGKSKASADAITAAAGREKLGQKEMTRRSVAGKIKEQARYQTTAMYSVDLYRKDHRSKSGERLVRKFNHTGVTKSDLQQYYTLHFPADKGYRFEFHKRTYVPRDNHIYGLQYQDGKLGEMGEGVAKAKYDPVQAVKQYAKQYMDMEGLTSVKQLNADDIENIGSGCQLDYKGVCEILGIKLPRSLGPAKSWGTDKHGNKFDLEEERETLQTKKGTIYKGGTYGNSYDPGEDDVKVKHVPKKGVKGRPKQEKPATASLNFPADPFGRTTGEIPQGKKGKKIAGKGNIDTVNESVNFQALAKRHGMGMDECMKTLNDHYKKYQMTGECSDLLNGAMALHKHHMDEAGPIGSTLGKIGGAIKTGAQHIGKAIVGKNDDELLRGLNKDVNGPNASDSHIDAVKAHPRDELDELARLAGLTIDEQNMGPGTGGMEENANDPARQSAGKIIDRCFGEIANYGDSGFEYLDRAAPIWFDLFDQFGGDIDAIIAGAPIDQLQSAAQELKSVSIDLGSGLGESKVAVTNPKNEPINNAHHNKYRSMKASTLNPGEGDSGEKAQHPDKPTFKNGDNALAKPANESAVKLEARLAREYESIKKKA